MSLKKFIFFIVDATGKSYQVVNGVVQLLSQPKQLPEAPDGNQDISIGWERSATYHGNIRSFSLSLGYLITAAKILRSFMYTNNMDFEVYLLVKRLTYEYTNTTFKEYYKQLYKGQFDFSTREDNQGDFRFNVNLLEGGLQKQLKASENIQYTIPFDVDAKNVVLDGMIVKQNGKFIMPDVAITQNQYIMPVSFISAEIYQNSALAFFTSQFTPYFGGPTYNFAPSEDYFLRTVKDVTVRIKGRIGVNSAGSYSFWIVGSSNTAIDPTNYPLEPGLYYVQPAVAAGDHVFDFDVTINLPAGEKLFFYTTHPFNTTDTYTETEIFVEFNFRPDTTIIKGFTLFDLGRKLSEKMFGSADYFESSFLETKNIILTSGDGVRSIENAAIKTTWRDYWKAVDVYCKAQMIITDKLRIYERITAYDSTQIPIAIGEAKKLKVTDAIDYLATSVKVGNAEQQIDDSNGKFDFNGFMIFSMPLKAIPDKPYDLQSGYKASPYEIEATRSNYDGKDTTDKDTDNDVYALAVIPPVSNNFDTTASFFADGTPFAPGQPLLGIVAPFPLLKPGMVIKVTGSVLNNQNLSVKSSTPWFFGQLIVPNEPLIDEAGVVINIEIVEGQIYTLDRTPVISQLTDPDVTTEIKNSVYNVPLSPKRILLLHKDWLASMSYGYESKALIFSSANRNDKLISDGIIEKADVPVTDLGAILFIPKYFEFDSTSPINMVEALQTQPNPIMSFIWEGITYTGFFIRGGIALNDLEEQTFKLLACPQNNLLNLI